MLSDRVQLSSAEAPVEEIVGGSVGVFELIQRIALAHTPNPSQPVPAFRSFRSFRSFRF